MDWPLIPIKRRNEIGAYCGALVILRLIAVGAGHTGAVAAIVAPRLVRVVLADPTGTTAASAINH
jgi:hypothetical protein